MNQLGVMLTEFAETEMRHYCRNPRCRSRLKEAVANKRDAFCTKGCHSSFYRHRCLICESKMERKTENQLICGKRRCRNALQAAENLGRYHGPSAVKGASKNVDFIGPKWVLVAGPRLTSNQFHCATIPDGPDCQWRGGEYERLEAQNRSALRAHFAELAKGCLIGPNDPPVNILGGHKFPNEPVIDLSPAPDAANMTIEEQTRLAGLLKEIPADLAIPAFLRRP